MTDLVHLNGELVPAADAAVNVRDRGFRYGDALFETLRAYDGEVRAWTDHWDRFARGSERIGMDHGLSCSEIRGRIDETLAANDLSDAYVRLSVTRGEQSGLLTPDPAVDPTVVIVAKPLPRGGVAGEGVWDGPATCAIPELRHVPDAALPAGLKSHNYLNGILGKQAARAAGADEAILLDTEGSLTEGTTSNLFFVRDGIVHTPSVERHPVLPGITRRLVLELARTAGFPVRTGSWDRDDLLAADEVFLTNTTWEVRPVAAVDDTSFEVGPITTELARAFDERIERRYYEG